MRKKYFAASAFCMLLLLGGCKKDILPDRTEIDQLEIIQVVGFDKSESGPDKIEVTIISEKPKGGDKSEGGGEASKVFTVTTEEAVTILEAERQLLGHTYKKMFFGYIDYVLVGEELAKDNISKCLDSFLRKPEVRFTPKIYIIRGSAKEFILKSTSANIYLFDRLKNIKSVAERLSNFMEVEVVEAASMLNNKYSAAILPVLRASDPHGETLIGGEGPEKDIEDGGYAVIKDYKLAGFIEPSIARGYNFLVGKVNSAAMSVKCPSGMYVGLEIIDNKTEIKANFNGDRLDSVQYTAHVHSNVSEQHSQDYIYDQSTLDELCARQSEIIKSEMEEVLAKSKEFGIDCTSLAEKIRMKHPLKWEKIKDNWNEIYPDLKIEVQVISQISRTYDFREQIGYEMGS